MLAVLVLVVLSYMGLPHYGIESDAATRIIQDMAPEEGVGPLREVPFDQLQPGVYEVGVHRPEDMCPSLDFGCPEFERVFKFYGTFVDEMVTARAVVCRQPGADRDRGLAARLEENHDADRLDRPRREGARPMNAKSSCTATGGASKP